jgi:hypothetical protein
LFSYSFFVEREIVEEWNYGGILGKKNWNVIVKKWNWKFVVKPLPPFCTLVAPYFKGDGRVHLSGLQ